MKLLATSLLVLGFLSANASSAMPSMKSATEKLIQTDDCPEDLTQIFGRIQFVDSFPDCKVKIVDSFEDIRVKIVDSFADEEALWKIVDSFPDFKIQVVESFPDFTVRFVDSFPGVQD